MTSGVTWGDTVVLPSVQEVLALPAVQAGAPEVLAGEGSLRRRVRWAHVTELDDIGGLLVGGELILTTGIVLPGEPRALVAYVRGLAEAGVAALAVELGRRFQELPEPLVRAAGRADLPLIALRREVPFVRVTEAVHALVASEQTAALRSSERAHEVFTALCVRGADVSEIVREAGRMTGCPVVFENLTHQVVAVESGEVAVDELLNGWESRSRPVRVEGRTGRAGPEGWVITSVEARGEVWGRLVLVPHGEPAPTQVMALERAATALTLNRLLEQGGETLERQAHRSLLEEIVRQRYRSAREVHGRTEALGVPTRRRVLIGVLAEIPARRRGAAGPDTGSSRVDERVSAALRAAGVPAIAAPWRGPAGSDSQAPREERPNAPTTSDDQRVAVLLALAPERDRGAALDELATALREAVEPAPVVAVGSAVRALDEVARSFAEAEQVAAGVRGTPVHQPYYEMRDIQLRGLMTILGGDPRLQSFVERSLGPLLEYDSRHRTELLATLRAHLEHAGNKSAAAQAAHLSRQAFHKRLPVIEDVLGVDLANPETRTSLHAAMMAWDSLRSR